MFRKIFRNSRHCRTGYAGGLISCLMTDYKECSFSLEYGPNIFCLHHNARLFTGCSTESEATIPRHRRTYPNVLYLADKRMAKAQQKDAP